MAGKKANRAVQTGAFMVRSVVRACLYIVALMVIVRVATLTYSFGYAVFCQQAMAAEGEGRDVYVKVEESDTVSDVARTLERERIIKDDKVFVVQEKLSEYRDQLRPGMYIISTDQTPEEILAILSGNDTEGQPGTDGEDSELSETEETHHDRG